MPGYSATPLAKKLGIKEGCTVCPIGEPADYAALLEPLPRAVQLVSTPCSPCDDERSIRKDLLDQLTTFIQRHRRHGSQRNADMNADMIACVAAFTLADQGAFCHKIGEITGC